MMSEAHKTPIIVLLSSAHMEIKKAYAFLWKKEFFDLQFLIKAIERYGMWENGLWDLSDWQENGNWQTLV